MITSMDWPTALTIASTILAAVLAVVGSIWVARRQVRRDSRIKLYKELLPQIQEYMSVGFGLLDREGSERDRPMIDSLNELRQTAELAGKKDLKLADDLISKLAASPPDWPPEPIDKNAPAYRALRGFYAYLKERIR